MFCVPRAKVKIFFPCGALYMVMNELNCMGGLCNIAFIVLPLNKKDTPSGHEFACRYGTLGNIEY